MRTRSLLVVFALAAFMLSAATASADPQKPFTANVAPVPASAPVEAGTVRQFTVTITNKAKQTLGAANVTVPPAFTVVSEPSTTRGTVTRSDNVLQLRDLPLATNGVVTVTVGLKMPCAGGTHTWGVVAKQANNFNGAGNDLGPVPATLSTTVNAPSGAARLRFVNQPASAESGMQVRAVAYMPNSDHLVTVEALNRCGERDTSFTGTVNLSLLDEPGPLSYTPVAAVAGLASFSNLTISPSGNYRLRATTDVSGYAPAESQRFKIIDVVELCIAGGTCTATLTGRETSVTMTGTGGSGTGVALLSLNLGRDPLTAPGCDAYEKKAPTSEWYEFNTTVDRVKTLDVTYSAAAVKEIGGVVKLQICFAAPISFTVKGGGTSPAFDYDIGVPGFAGLLPDCPYKPTGPCILKRESLGGGGGYDAAGYHPSGDNGARVRVFVPLAFDPRMH